jgi:ABC transporter with metal-binding/Fe-S-binding domain ATP-binding protein
MRLGVLFSGGKDSNYAAFFAKKNGYDITCLISMISDNPESYMFHTPSINKVSKQAEAMEIPIIMYLTEGKKERELFDLENAIKVAMNRYKIEGVVSGAVESVYQASRIQTICNKLGIECFNPLWQKEQAELLNELVKNGFEIILVGVSAYPFDKKWLGRKIDEKFITEMKNLNKKYGISLAGEGGEFESFVINSPMFKKELRVGFGEVKGKGNSYSMEVIVR